MELSTHKKVKLAAQISSQLIPFQLPALIDTQVRNTAMPGDSEDSKEEVAERPRIGKVDASVRVKMSSITGNLVNLVTSDMQALKSRGSSNAKNEQDQGT